MPPPVRVDDGDRAPAFWHEIRITFAANKKRKQGAPGRAYGLLGRAAQAS
jgi:hypothetical protein